MTEGQTSSYKSFAPKKDTSSIKLLDKLNWKYKSWIRFSIVPFVRARRLINWNKKTTLHKRRHFSSKVSYLFWFIIGIYKQPSPLGFKPLKDKYTNTRISPISTSKLFFFLCFKLKQKFKKMLVYLTFSRPANKFQLVGIPGRQKAYVLYEVEDNILY